MEIDFAEARPGAEIIELVPTEGDADHVYYRSRFREGADSKVLEEEWGYRRRSGGRWERFYPDSTGQPLVEMCSWAPPNKRMQLVGASGLRNVR